ncbi:hypothetical protein, partial [Micromonospora orduensis]|uniref:hypothetical protein n=1 Tax=Micromonospora orduensis TaxID=1420891 RepID=UPI0033DA2912
KQVNSNAGVATGSTKISDIEGSTFTGTGEYSLAVRGATLRLTPGWAVLRGMARHADWRPPTG